MPPQPRDAEKSAPASSQDVTTTSSSTAPTTSDTGPKKFPKGVVLGPDGKPCRSCTSIASWAAMVKKQTTQHPNTPSTPPAAATTSLSPPPDCPPDVDALGRASWTLLHSIAATYPEAPTATQQRETRQFLTLFGKLYPCWVCAEDFQRYMAGENAPRVGSREELGRWMCEAHNAVNVKLGKERFDCARWEERWRTGWRDGRCD